MGSKAPQPPPPGNRKPSPPPPPPPKRRGRERVQMPPPPVIAPPTPSLAQNVVNINLNRKLMTHGIVGQMRDTAKSKGMVAGTAIVELLDEYDRMRYLMESLITAYERNNEVDVRKVLDILRLLL